MSYRKNDRTRISNVPLREPFQKSKLAHAEIARQLGKVSRTTGKMETSGLQRMIGLRSSPGSRHKGVKYAESWTSTIGIDDAKALCVILGEDFDQLYDGWLPEQEPAAHCNTCGDPMLRRVPSGQCGFCVLELEEFGRIDYQVAA